MKAQIFTWLRQKRRLLVRQLILVACALALGLGCSLWRSDTYLPSIDGNIYSMLALDDSLLMVLSQGNRNSLVRISHTGALLNYMDTVQGQAFQYLESDGETVYAILSYEKSGAARQRLVSLSLKHAAMRARPLAELTGLRGAPADVVWQQIYLPAEGEIAPTLKLAGLDGRGQGYLARWNMADGQWEVRRILPDEPVLFLKYVSDGHYVWVSQSKEVGQYIGGIWQRDILSGTSHTPLHISTCGTRCFISDSVSGDIFQILPDGSSVLFRRGTDGIGSSGFQYRQLEIYTTYLSPEGEVRVVGLCAGEQGSVNTGEDWNIRALHPGILRLLMVWRHGWPAAAVCWIILAALVEAVHGVVRSPRLSVRLLLCEVMAAAFLFTAVTAVQYHSFQQTIREEAYQKLRLIGGSLAAALASGEPGESPDSTVQGLERQVGAAVEGRGQEYAVCVVWNTESGPIIASDSAVPDGYLLEDVKSRGYFSAISQALRSGTASLERVQTDISFDYVYAQPFFQGGRSGCVAVSQSEDSMLAGQLQFFRSLLPILAACPPLFLALAWITRRLLSPLDEIQRALEEFYTCGSGGQMCLENMPRTELYEVGRVFNQLSVQTRVQLNELRTINDSYVRLVPDCLLAMLRKRGVTQLEAGGHTPVDGALLILIPRNFSPGWENLDRLTRPAADHIAQSGGMLVDYDEGLNALVSLFPRAEGARACALACLEDLERQDMPVMAAVLEETVELGVFGSEKLLYPLAVSRNMSRKQEALARLLGFGAMLVHSGRAPGTGLRLLGWDGGLAFYEDPACRPSGWRSQWRLSAGLWEEALRRFRERDFSAAGQLFAKVLRLMPEDMAARWYLFRCEALRGGTPRAADTGLLFDWEGSGHG